MKPIGERIKELREQRSITGKDLATRAGLSQSQITRLEKGQRRVDSEVLVRLADALGITPAAFFETDPKGTPPSGRKKASPSSLAATIGRSIRSARRQRHWTVDDLARRTGFSRAYLLSVEEGRRSGLEDDFLPRVAKLLGINGFDLLAEIEKILPPGTPPATSTLPVIPGSGVPLLVAEVAPYPSEIDENGNLRAAVEGMIQVPGLDLQDGFAVRVADERMAGSGGGFSPGEIVVFDGSRPANSGEVAFVRLGESGRTTFCQFFCDDPRTIRLQYLRSEEAPEILPTEAVGRSWPLVAHLRVSS